MSKFFITTITALSLCGCASNTRRVDDIAVKTEFVEKLVPVVAPCEQKIQKEELDRSIPETIEDKVDKVVFDGLKMRSYIFRLELGFVACGGTLE